MDGVVIVTIPSEVSRDVVKKAVTFARMMNATVIGVIENMSGFVCPKCGEQVNIFGEGGGQKIAKDMKVPFLGRIPIDTKICEASDKGIPFVLEHPDSSAAKAFMEIVKKIEAFLKQEKEISSPTEKESVQ
jgi:MinD-like ATPase involved in chromosome partitioning or flagellar assembly